MISLLLLMLLSLPAENVMTQPVATKPKPSVLPIRLWSCMPKNAAETKLLCQMHGLFASGTNPRVLEHLYVFHAAPDPTSCAWEDVANCTYKHTGESGHFCYNTQAGSPTFRVPVYCRPLPHTDSHMLGSSITMDSTCDVALISAAQWTPGTKLHMKVVIGTQSERQPGDQLQISLTSPSGRLTERLIINWEACDWQLKGNDLSKQGPPDWVLPISGTNCNQKEPLIQFKFYGHITITEESDEDGIWQVELGTQNKTTLRFNPLLTNLTALRKMENPLVGSHVLKLDQPKQIVMHPQTSLKEVQIHLQGLNISESVPKCAPYLSTSHQGWFEWVTMWKGVQHHERITRAINDWIAPIGAGISLMGAANVEVLANKLSYSTRELGKMAVPLSTSLGQLALEGRAISKVFPGWESLIEADNKRIVSETQSLQNNISLALACQQAQAFTQTVVMGMIRDAHAGHIPLEVTNLIKDNLSPGEVSLEAWWKLVNATYDPTKHMLRIFILTVESPEIFTIYPVVSLGFQISSNLVMYSRDTNRWARYRNGDWQTLSVAGCRRKEDLGFICEDNNFEMHSDCFSPLAVNNSHCSFDVTEEFESTVVYIGRACICIRTFCDFILINGVRIQPTLPDINRCFCNVSVVVGCDFQFRVPVWTVQHLEANPSLYHYILPVSLGFGLLTLQQILSHPDLQQELHRLKTLGENATLVVDHNNQQIAQILATVETAGDHSWWETLFGWSPTATSSLNIALHPIVVILAFQVILVIVMVVITRCMFKQARRIQDLERGQTRL